MEAIGKHDPRLVAQRQRFDSYLDKAAAKEDFQGLEREKKRVRFEETVPDVPSSTEASSSSGSKSSSSKRESTEDVDDNERGIRAKVQEKRGEKRADDEEPDREVRTKFREKRGEKRPEDGDPEREVRAKVREKRGEKKEFQRKTAVRTWTRQQQQRQQLRRRRRLTRSTLQLSQRTVGENGAMKWMRTGSKILLSAWSFGQAAHVLISSLLETRLWSSGLPGPKWKLNMWSM